MNSNLILNDSSHGIKISNVYSLNKYDNENHLMELTKEPEKRLQAIKRSQEVLKSLRNKAITKVVKPQILTRCLSSNIAINNKKRVNNLHANSVLKKAIDTCEEAVPDDFDKNIAKEFVTAKNSTQNASTSHPINENNLQVNIENSNADKDLVNPRSDITFKDIVLQGKEVDLLKASAIQSSEKNDSVEESKTSEAVITNVLDTLGISNGDLFSIRTNKGSRFWICPVKECDHLTARLNSLKIHILEHYRYKPFKCDFEDCSWSFYTAFKLRRHKEIHSGSKDYPCEEDGCFKRFTTIYNLRLHRKLHERPKIHACNVPECAEHFRTKRELEKHLKIHDPVYAPYKCPVESCGNSYFSHSALISHSRSHQYKLDELKCQWENCGKMFDQPCRLKEHMRQHTGDRPYKCQYKLDNRDCTASFVSSSKLRRHERSHINDRKYTCTYEKCGKSFFRKEHLRQHTAMRHEQNFITCPATDCGLVFLSKSCLNRHVSNMHSGQKKSKRRKNKLENEPNNEYSPELANESGCNDMAFEQNPEPCYEIIEEANGTPKMWINFDELDYSTQNAQAQSSNMIHFNLSDIAGPSGIISEELKKLINECTLQAQSEFNATENSTAVNNVDLMDTTNEENCQPYEGYNEHTEANNTELNKFYNGITLENGISVKLGDLSENFEQNVEECIENENVSNELINPAIPMDIEHLKQLIDAENFTLQFNENGEVVSILENETVNNSVMPNSPDGLLHDENDILETVKKKEVESEDEDTCARTLLTYQHYCEAKLKLQFNDDKDKPQDGILDNSLISEESEIVKNDSIDDNDISYDVDDISAQYLSLINRESVYKEEEVSNELHLNRSKLRLQTYSMVEDKLSALCNESDIDNLNWVNKSLNDSNDGFNYEIKRDISTSSFMQYGMIESFDEKHEPSALHDGIADLLTIDNLDPNFYEHGDTTFTANSIRSIKDNM